MHSQPKSLRRYLLIDFVYSHSHGYFVDMASKLGARELQIEEAEEIAIRMRQRCDNEEGLYSLTNEDAASIFENEME